MGENRDTLERLYDVILSRKGGDPVVSHTAKLFAKGRAKIAQKMGEEAVELAIAAVSETREEMISNWIVGYLKSHGIEAGIEQVLITSGAQQALDFLGRALINPGDAVVMSSPSYLGAIQVFGTYQPTFISVPMDDEGVLLNELEAAFRQKPKFFYLTPDFCNPAGITTSLARRQAILKLAHRYNVAILEDSPYEELRYAVRIKVDLDADAPKADLEALVQHVKKWSPVANTFMKPVGVDVVLG